MKKSIALSIGLLLCTAQTAHSAAAASRLISTKGKIASLFAVGLGFVYYGDYQRSTNTKNPELDALFHLGERTGDVIERGGKAGAEIIANIGIYLKEASEQARKDLEEAGIKKSTATSNDTPPKEDTSDKDPDLTDL